MALKRKRPIEEPSPDPLSQHSSSSSSSDLSSIASTNAEDPVPTSDLATAVANDIALDADADAGAASIFSDRRVTNRTKTLVRIRENHKCWLCGFHGVHIAHVVARADAILLSSYIAQGLLQPDFGFHGLPNLMLLCAGCHHNFDVRIPIWAFLPSDLQGFVDREREFHRLRAIAATNGICLQREHRAAEEISYTRYLVRLGFISPAPFQQTPQKKWVGDAIATILRSQSVISGHVRVPADQGGMPESTMDTLYQLLRLYATPPPTVAAPAEQDMHRGRSKSQVEIRARSKRRRFQPGRQRGPTPASATSADVSPSHLGDRRHRWTLGPGYSSNDAIRYVCGGLKEEDGVRGGAVIRGGRGEGCSP